MPERTRMPIPASAGVILLFIGLIFVIGTVLQSGIELHMASASEQCWNLDEPVGVKPEMGESVAHSDWIYFPTVGPVCEWFAADGGTITEFHPNLALTVGGYFGVIAGLAGCVIVWRRS